MVFANSGSTLPIIILAIVVGAFALIALIAFIIHKILHPKFKDEDKIDEKEAVKENLDRILEDVDDEETAKQIANYRDEEDEK